MCLLTDVYTEKEKGKGSLSLGRQIRGVVLRIEHRWGLELVGLVLLG